MSYISDITKFVTENENWRVEATPPVTGHEEPTLTADKQFHFRVSDKDDENRDLFCAAHVFASIARKQRKKNPTANITDPDSFTGRDKAVEFAAKFKQVAAEAGVDPRHVELEIDDDYELPGMTVKVTIPEPDLERVRGRLAASNSELRQLAL